LVGQVACVRDEKYIENLAGKIEENTWILWKQVGMAWNLFTAGSRYGPVA